MTFNPNMRCRTRSGLSAEIIAVLPEEKASRYGERIVALITESDGEHTVETYRADGRYMRSKESGWDLVNIPTPVVTVEQYTELLKSERRRVRC